MYWFYYNPMSTLKLMNSSFNENKYTSYFKGMKTAREILEEKQSDLITWFQTPNN